MSPPSSTVACGARARHDRWSIRVARTHERIGSPAVRAQRDRPRAIGPSPRRAHARGARRADRGPSALRLPAHRPLQRTLRGPWRRPARVVLRHAGGRVRCRDAADRAFLAPPDPLPLRRQGVHRPHGQPLRDCGTRLRRARHGRRAALGGGGHPRVPGGGHRGGRRLRGGAVVLVRATASTSLGAVPRGLPAWSAREASDLRRTLVSPPVAPTLHVFARIVAEIGRAEDEDLEALRPALVASPRAGRDAHHVPLLDLDDLVVELHPPAPAHDHVQLLLLLVRVAVWEAIAGRDALVAKAALLELERLACEAELQVRRAVEVGPEILQILLEVPEREWHGSRA